MRAKRTRRPTDLGVVLALLAALGLGTIACGGSTPMDMWISKDPDAGTGFEAPVRETRPSDSAPEATGAGGSGAAAGGDGLGGTSGAAGGDAGSGGGAGTDGTAGTGGAS
jgi:alkyldihydroxyacetonephosphate synthase